MLFAWLERRSKHSGIIKEVNAMKAVFINSHDVPYARMIARKEKPLETRNKNMLRACVGETVALCETGKRDPLIIGYGFIDYSIYKTAEWLDKNRKLTRIPKNSKYDVKTGGKWCYHFINIKECKPYKLPDNAIRHGRAWCEFEL